MQTNYSLCEEQIDFSNDKSHMTHCLLYRPLPSSLSVTLPFTSLFLIKLIISKVFIPLGQGSRL
ncbi:hypothetical protein BR93DRAFT_923952 [Coniochaeta sp. PMI_546]|nr:hypothetical protein BR93DRAFT_923952 [Coniochaeta sp. PMI_546]